MQFHRRCADHRHAAAAVIARGYFNQSARSGGIVKIDAIELEALHCKIMNQHIVGFVNGNADR